MPDGSSRQRHRASRLTDEALRLLEERVARVWSDMGHEGRVTRAGRAALLGVSISTASRIFARAGNDRSVLRQSFHSVGLPWNDAYCEIMTLQEADVAPVSGPSLRKLFRRSSSAWALAVATAALAVTGGFVALKSGAAEQGPRLTVLNHEGRMAYNRGDQDAALRLAADAQRLARELCSADGLAEALRLEGDALAAKGDLEAAIAKFQESLPIWRTFEQKRGLSMVLESLGVAKARLGNLDEAEEHFKESLGVLRDIEPQSEPPYVLRWLGSIAALRGNTTAARVWFDRAAHLIADQPKQAMQIDIKALRGMTLCLDGSHDQALKEISSCLEHWEAREHPRWIANTLVQRSTVLVASGRHEEARSDLERAHVLYAEANDTRGAALTAQWLQAPDLGAYDPVRQIENFF
ncbi:MAG: tetratricopeptide repeat protein [Fimbriimonadaceae bacterium]|nr:tetratricopeptide repeat protein [Fimbriimonadaceae bacterium]QYK57436.1 MAG: tetratricopeptide repeat protein [Fimbriimonadaceae bacterium]